MNIEPYERFRAARRPRNFDEYLEESIKKDGINSEHKYVTSRKDWLKALKESKAEAVIDKIPADQLPECDDIKSSKVGDFMSREKFEEMYDDEKERLIDNLKDGSMLAYSGADGVVTWWKRRDNKEGDGLIRIR